MNGKRHYGVLPVDRFGPCVVVFCQLCLAEPVVYRPQTAVLFLFISLFTLLSGPGMNAICLFIIGALKNGLFEAGRFFLNEFSWVKSNHFLENTRDPIAR